MREMRDDDLPQVMEIEHAAYFNPRTAGASESERSKASSIYLVAVECVGGAARRSEAEHESIPAVIGGQRRDRPRNMAVRAVHRQDALDPKQAMRCWSSAGAG